MRSQSANTDVLCPHCGSTLPAAGHFCSACGRRQSRSRERAPQPARVIPAVVDAKTDRIAADHVQLAGRGVRLSSALLDIAAMLSPTLPLAIAAATLRVAQVVYIVMPVAFAAVWVWMQIWQGLTGSTFGKAMLGLRLVRATDNRHPGLGAVLIRSGVFIATFGLAALPVMRSRTPRSGLHDRVSGLKVIDLTHSPGPDGTQPPAGRRRPMTPKRRVSSPISITSPGWC